MYSKDYREGVFQIKEEENLTYEETSKRFKINIRTLFRWKKRLSPKLKREKPATKIDMKKLATDVERNPDKFLYERAKDLKVGITTVFYALKRLKISRKKNSQSSKSR